MGAPDLREYLAERLRDDGYGGLCNRDGECGCGVEDLQPCGDAFRDCALAYRWECEGCKIGESTRGCEFYEYAGGCYRVAQQGGTA